MSKKSGYLAVRILMSLGIVAALVFWVLGQFYDPDPVDTDGDGMTDAWEECFFGTGFSGVYNYGWPYDPWDDPDCDWLCNADESAWGTDPWNPDWDEDGLTDGWEVLYAALGFDPLVPSPQDGFHGAGDNPDWDMRPNGLESALGSAPTVVDWEDCLYDWDSDYDGDMLSDMWEYVYGVYGFNPYVYAGSGDLGYSGDPDEDGLANFQVYSAAAPEKEIQRPEKLGQKSGRRAGWLQAARNAYARVLIRRVTAGAMCLASASTPMA